MAVVVKIVDGLDDDAFVTPAAAMYSFSSSTEALSPDAGCDTSPKR